jgi:hypothetical protein
VACIWERADVGGRSARDGPGGVWGVTRRLWTVVSLDPKTKVSFRLRTVIHGIWFMICKVPHGRIRINTCENRDSKTVQRLDRVAGKGHEDFVGPGTKWLG